MLTKDLLRVSRAGGVPPQFAKREHRPLAARVVGTYQGHAGETRGDLGTPSPIWKPTPRLQTRSRVRGAARARRDVRDRSADRAGASAPGRVRGRRGRRRRNRRRQVGRARGRRRLARVFGRRPRAVAVRRPRGTAGPDGGRRSLGSRRPDRPVQSLARTDRAVRRDRTPGSLERSEGAGVGGQTVAADVRHSRTGRRDDRHTPRWGRRPGERPRGRRHWTHTSSATRRYGTRFARLLRSIANADEWFLEATIDDRGTDRRLSLSRGSDRGPRRRSVADVEFDSSVESEFAARVSALDLEWNLVREPEPSRRERG